MVTVLRASGSKGKSTKDSWADAFGGMVGQYFEGQKENQEKEKKNESLKKAGIDPDLPPEMQKLMMQYDLMGVLEEKKLNDQYELKSKFENQKYKQRQDLLKSIYGNSYDQEGIPDVEVSGPIEDQINEAISQVEQQTGPMDERTKKYLADSLRENPEFSQKGQGTKREKNPFEHAERLALIGEHDAARIESDRVKAKMKQESESAEAMRDRELAKSQAKTDSDYYQKVKDNHKSSTKSVESLNRLEKLNKKGVTGKAYEQFLERVGLTSKTSTGRREFSSLIKNLIGDISKIVGGKVSNFEFGTLLNAVPSENFSKEANEAIIQNLLEFESIKQKEYEIANSLKMKNKGKLPEDFEEKVNNEMQKYLDKTLPEIKRNIDVLAKQIYPEGKVPMVDENGEKQWVPYDEVDEAINDFGYQAL